jgi:hypothetical protein
LAADQGHPIAQNMLGLCYATGNGVIKNIFTAQEYYRLAAQQGLHIASSNLEKLNEEES